MYFCYIYENMFDRVIIGNSKIVIIWEDDLVGDIVCIYLVYFCDGVIKYFFSVISFFFD